MNRLFFRTLTLATALLGSTVAGNANGASGAAPGASAQTAVLDKNQADKVELNSRWDLGYYLFQMQEYSAAAVEFEKIRKVLPDDPSLLALIGSCYSMSGNWKEGEKALLQAKAQNPDDDDINGLLGQFYVSAGQSLKGAAYMEHSLKVSPEQDDLRAHLATLYLDAGRGERARYHLEYLLRNRGEEGFAAPDLDNDYARCMLQAGKFKEALAHAERAHNADPRNARYARVLGLCLMGMHRYSEAAAMLSSGRNEIQSEEVVYLQWGEALFLDRRWDEAEAVWLEGVSRFPSSYELLTRLADYYLGADKPVQARRALAFAESRNPGHPGNLLLSAHLDRKMGDFAAAWKSLERLKRQACGAMALDALWEEAQLDYVSGKYGACDKTLDGLLHAKNRQARNHRAEAHMLKAKLALYKGDKRVAQAEVLKAKDANPYDLKIYSLAREAFRGADQGATLSALLKDARDLQ